MHDVEIHFGEGKTAVRAVSQLDLQVVPGEFVSVLGPSGCGKSTLIGAVAGFTRVSSGELYVDGRTVQAPGPDRGVVFQHHTLFPWKTVLKNVEFGLKMRRAPPAECTTAPPPHAGAADQQRLHAAQAAGPGAAVRPRHRVRLCSRA
jgi:NitT/TauT family transport system ATP-binding protein